MINITIERKHAYLIAVFVVIAALLVPVGARASHQFGDVPNTYWAHNDISWLKNTGLTVGCGDGSNYCPEDFVKRGEMAAFMRRLAEKQVVDAKEVNGGTAWMRAQTPAPTIDQDIIAAAATRYNSEGGSITYRRIATGTYIATFNNWDQIGSVQVTPIRTGFGWQATSCAAQAWIGVGKVSVTCFRADQLEDTQFYLTILGN